MNKFKLGISLSLISLSLVFGMFLYYSNSTNSKVTDQNTKQSVFAIESPNRSENSQHDSDMDNDPGKLKSVVSEGLGADIFSTIDDLKLSWEDEYGCLTFQKPDDVQCEYPELNASSYEDALWMSENGYPSASKLRAMEALDDKDLLDLSRKNPQSSLPLTILANRYAANGDLLASKTLFRRSLGRNMKPFGLLRSGMSLVQHADPNGPGWSYRTAAIEFKKAALLGDYAGEQLYYELINSYWNGNPGLAVTTGIIETAMWELSNYFDLPQHQWPVEPRPTGG